ncbi:hypothetical protein Vi05172_g4581 [Venturia inaequalis]|nr:hypothetical protein Vi05172_g4581 [Venturia inaequalis]
MHHLWRATLFAWLFLICPFILGEVSIPSSTNSPDPTWSAPTTMPSTQLVSSIVVATAPTDISPSPGSTVVVTANSTPTDIISSISASATATLTSPVEETSMVASSMSMSSDMDMLTGTHSSHTPHAHTMISTTTANTHPTSANQAIKREDGGFLALVIGFSFFLLQMVEL